MPKLVHLEYFEQSIDAHKAQQILEENGITSYVANEQTIQSDWLLSQALGGLQLQVFEVDFQKAKDLLTQWNSDNGKALEVEHTIDHPLYPFVCPECGSNHIYNHEKPDGWFGLSWLLIGIPIKTPSKIYICYYCSHKFKK